MRVIAALLPFLLIACDGGDGYVPVRVRDADAARKDTLVRGNRDAVRLEDRDIERYVERMGVATVRTPRGVHIQLIRDLPGDHGQPEQWATINYRMELLNGDSAYSSAPGEPESFLIEHDDVESGLHEAIQHLSPGDSALFIIPSYRAHGLVGDMEKIPMRSSVVYRIGLVKLSGGRP
jgi:FKBP-type peptidyl-prolyl cis-trans isomerase FkpA